MTMRRFRLLLRVLMFATMIPLRAGADAPTVDITYPVANAVIDEVSTPAILLQASAADPDEPIRMVTFYVCPSTGSACTGELTAVGSSTTAPYQVRWKPDRVLSQTTETLHYLASAIAQNTLGQGRQSVAIPFTLLQPPPPPGVTLIVPNIETGYVTPASPVLYATASPGSTLPPSTIARVDFLDGETVLGSVATPNAVPSGYAFVWRNAPQGTHLVGARAIDSLGYATTTNPVTVYIVGPDPPPEVSLAAPTTGQIFAAPNAVPLAATATSSLGTIQRVEFVTRDTVVGTALSPPYVASWPNPPPGNFAIVAKAFDDIGVAATSPAAYIQVLESDRSPAVVLTAPAPSTTIASGMSLTLTAAALAPDGAIGRVDFYSGGALLGSANSPPYQFVWSNPSAGSLSLTAKAFDLKGNAGISAPLAINVTNNRPPTVNLTSPAPGAQYSAPATIALAANASDVDGTVVKIDFFAAATKIASSTGPAFDASWTGVPIGSYSLTAVATDNLGATATSVPVTVTVNGSLPTISLTSPSAGASYGPGQAIVITAEAYAPSRAISRVDFYSDGSPIGIINVAGGPALATVDLTLNNAPVGMHALTAKVTTADGTSASSAAVTVNVVDLAVALSEPNAGQAYPSPGQIRFTANPTESAGSIARVDFYGDGVIVGTSAQPPYTHLWANVGEGTHTASARVWDGGGFSANSAIVQFSVQSIGLTIDFPVAPPGLSASANSDFVTVRGTYVGPANTGVTVNGEIAETDGAGNFAINGIPLGAGDNPIVAVMTTIDGATASKTLTVASSGNAPFQISALPNSGFVPLTVTLIATSRGVGPAKTIQVANAGTATLDTSTFDGQTLGTLTFAAPGMYLPQITVTYGAAFSYSQTLAVVVRDNAAMDRMFIDMFNRFTSALSVKDRAGALQHFTEPNRAKYGAAFAAMEARLPQIVDTFKAFGGVSMSSDIAEYALKRVINGKTKIYLLDFLRDGDGVWRLDSM